MADISNSKPISTLHLSWAAGFLEGEGSFLGGKGKTSVVCAAQVQREPLERLHALFGGRIVLKNGNPSMKRNPIWYWSVYANRSIQIMMTLFVLMSPRRQKQIEGVLRGWGDRKNIRPRESFLCTRGHALVGENAYVFRGRVSCRECRLAAGRRRNRKVKVFTPYSIRKMKKGQSHYKSKLTDHQVDEIRTEVAGGVKQNATAIKYGVSPQTINDIVGGKSRGARAHG